MSKPIPAIYSIEGNIGAGKTTLLENLEKKLAGSTEILFLREPVDLWNTFIDKNGETILSNFYKKPSEFAFAFQVMAYSTRLAMLRDMIENNSECKVIICERSLEADRNIFAKMLHDDNMIDDMLYKIYKTFFNNSANDYPLAGIVYVRADADTCFDRVGKRAREGESNIELGYLEKCGQYHDNWLRTNNIGLRMLEINANENVTYGVDGLGEKWMEECLAFCVGEGMV